MPLGQPGTDSASHQLDAILSQILVRHLTIETDICTIQVLHTRYTDNTSLFSLKLLIVQKSWH